MVNFIWMFLIIISFIAAMVQGTMNELSEAMLNGAKQGVTLCFGLISVLVFWLGLMRIAEDAGLLHAVSRRLEPLVRALFPQVPSNHRAIGYIMSNMSANLFGLGNAATPLGIKAMQELQSLNPHPHIASPAMCTLLALNTASITLIPTTVIAIRMTYNAAEPTDIVGTTLLATAVSTGFAIWIDWFYRRRALRKGSG
jgi:spore maturation protein A